MPDWDQVYEPVLDKIRSFYVLNLFKNQLVIQDSKNIFCLEMPGSLDAKHNAMLYKNVFQNIQEILCWGRTDGKLKPMIYIFLCQMKWLRSRSLLK